MASVRRAGNANVVRMLWWVWYALDGDGRVGWEKGMGRVSWYEYKEVKWNDDRSLGMLGSKTRVKGVRCAVCMSSISLMQKMAVTQAGIVHVLVQKHHVQY